MLSLVVCLLTVTALGNGVKSAPAQISNAAVDKLTFLDKEGYEVISDMEEILTPVSPEQDNGIGVDLPDAQSAIVSKPEMLLYGRFYVLKKKDPNAETSQMDKTDYSQFFGFRGPQRKMFPTSSPRNTGNSDSETASLHQDSSIVFPGESATTEKRYIRQRKDDTFQSNPTVQLRVGRHQYRTRKPVLSLSTPKSELIPPQSPTESPSGNDFDAMTSTQLLSWARENLKAEDVQRLIEESESTDTTEIPLEDTTDPNIQYNSFILIPGLKCPEGERMNHRGICTPKYAHVHHTHNQEKLNARRKLLQLLKSLKKLETKVEDELHFGGSNKSKTQENEKSEDVETTEGPLIFS